jgi:hypothetical protein
MKPEKQDQRDKPSLTVLSLIIVLAAGAAFAPPLFSGV